MAFIPSAIGATGFDYTPNAGQWLSFVGMQPYKTKRMAEGVRFFPFSATFRIIP
jgi:hypothetical protein